MAARVKLGGPSDGPQKKRKINLLVKEGFENTTLGRFLNWALTAGRVIVIATELIVILAFLSRFQLDRTLTDLNEKNQARKAQIEALADFEETFRSAQARLKAYAEWDTSILGSEALILEVASLLPADVSLESISFSGKTVSLRGTALSEAGLAGFLKELKESEKFQDVALNDITLDTTTQILGFTINGGIKSGTSK